MKKSLKTYKEVSEITGKTVKQLIQLSYKLQLQPRQIAGKAHFNDEQIEKLLDYKPPQRKSKQSRRKVSIIEEYLRVGSARKVASIMRIQKELVNKTVKEWRENDEYVTVDSSMNYTHSSDFDNVRRYGGKWVYDYNLNGVKYYKGGFETELDAFYELCKLKEGLKIGEERRDS